MKLNLSGRFFEIIDVSVWQFGNISYFCNDDMAQGCIVETFWDLQKVLAGKKAYVSPYVNMYTEGLEGYSTPKDFVRCT